MNKSRLDALERRLRHGDAPPELVALLKRLKAEQGDTTPHTPDPGRDHHPPPDREGAPHHEPEY